MYHCNLKIYCTGPDPACFAALRALPPLASFVHTFTESAAPEPDKTAAADVIFADLRGTDAVGTAQALAGWMHPGAGIILLADSAQTASLMDSAVCPLPNSADIWTLPMSDAQWQFRLARWQQACGEKTDAWETAQFLEATINGSPDMVWYKTKDGIHEKVNNAFCKIVGKTMEQVQGRGHAYIWNVEHDDPACIESERIVMESRETLVSEEIVQAGDETKTLTTYKSPLYDLDGSVMGTVGIAIDITRERAYADELVRRNQMMETLFTSLECGVICHSLDGQTILRINQAALRLLGYTSQDDLIHDGFFSVAPTVVDEDKPRLRAAMQSLKNPGDSVSLEYRVSHPGGEVLQILGNLKLVEENGMIYYQRFLLDITAQKQREKAERQREKQRQMELIHALSIEYNLVCHFDLDTGKGESLRIGDCPHGLIEQNFSGNLLLDTAFNTYIDECVLKDDRAGLYRIISAEHLKQELSEKQICHLNFSTECCGYPRYFQMKVVRAGTWSENHHNVVLGIRSIDEEMQEERARQEVLQNALLQANQANRAKSTFLSNMSHDIRTPMNAIIGFTTLALTHIDRREQVEEYLKKIMTSGNHLLSLINDILDMSRIENGKIHLEEHPCSLPEILHGLRNIIQADVHTKQLDLYMDVVDVQHENICCDRLRLNQVLLNLLSNAVKYTPSGGMVSLKVVEKADAPAGCGKYEFRVKDNGIGMSEEFVAHIFEPFERERNSTISGIQGTGLGMAITQSIVTMMNGTIEVKSQKNVGTECIVSLTFPLGEDDPETPSLPELNGLRALVVDDDFNVCDSVSCMLNQIGLRAEWTLSGKEAVLRTRQAVMRDDQYSVYIIDWLLPDMNGIEVTRRIRQETGGEVPIIVLTAYDWSDIEEEAREAGVTAFCSKPLFLSELRACLHSVVHAGEDQPEQYEEPHVIARGERILLAEDNELNREIATALLEEAGFVIDAAENGQIAVEKLRSSEPGYYRLVLMDVQMPVMNGYDATRAIRKLENPELAAIPILAMTANAFEEDKREALNSGMNGHIAKPIDIDSLLHTLEETLQ